MRLMSLAADTRRRLGALAKRHRAAAEKADAARLELREALLEARQTATVRELADATGLSFQRVQQIVGNHPRQGRS